MGAFLDVHPVTVKKWVARHRAGGDDGLKAKPTPGRPRFLTGAQERQVLGWLNRSRTEYGFDTGLLDRAPGGRADPHVIRGPVPPERPARVTLGAQLLPAEARAPDPATGPTGDRPVGGPGREADSKKARAERAYLVLIDETGLFLNPLVRRSWAPRGRTPVIRGDGGRRHKVSVIGAVTVSPRTRRLGLYFTNRIDGYFGAGEVVAFLQYLLRALPVKVLVVWDRGPNHKDPVIRAFLRRNARVHRDRLPPDAPEWNPGELGWSGLKYAQRSNFVPGARPIWTT